MRGLILGVLVFFGAMACAEDQGRSLKLDMKDADIRGLIEWMAEQTGKNIVIDPRVKGQVSIVTRDAIGPADLDQLLSSVLSIHGYALLREGGVYKVVPEGEAKFPRLSAGARSAEGDNVIKLFKLRHVSAVQLVSLIKPMLPKAAYISAFPERNFVVVADRAVNIAKIDELVGRLDQGEEIGVEIIYLEYAQVDDVLSMVNNVFPKADGQASFFSVTADMRTNSLILAGDEAARERVRALVFQLDQKVERVGDTQVHYLHYVSAADILPIVQKLSATLQKREMNLDGAVAEISIQASEATNALIVTAPPTVAETLSHIIKKLDIRRAQVLVEAVIVEVLEGDGRELGVEWRTSAGAKGDEGWYGGTLFRSGGDAGTVDEAPNLLTGLSMGFYRNGSLRGLIYALETSDKMNILSRPNLVTLDNEEARIVVGQNVPFVTGRSTSAATPVDNPFQTIERRDVGVTLTVRPRVNEGDAVTLDILQEISSVSNATVSQAQDIITNTRSIRTRVLVEDGQTLVLGGLISDEVQKSEAGVPYLSKIPLLGRLFRSNNGAQNKSNLMIFIQPHIIHDRQEAQLVTGGRYRYIDDAAREMGYELPGNGAGGP